eukprot:TRINITY_DN11191_c0_g1_i2.p1 TRINITY_DN11191_c0_g1~~TRINITY_DN11191_c0_g1_i2.p1  ORF type:complete len:641 (-),score=133.33 TRINITY_DN11191_c0_g1_i2:57-1751(-)
MKDAADSSADNKLAKRKKKGTVDPKQFVVAFINEVNCAVSTERRAMVINNLYNMHNPSINSKFVEFNGLKIISEWFLKAAQLNESLVIECLVHLLSGLPFKKSDVEVCSIESSMQTLLQDHSHLLSGFTKKGINRFLQIVSRAQNSGDFISLAQPDEGISRKRKLGEGIRWLPDSNLVIEASVGDEFFVSKDNSPDESAAKRLKVLATSVAWRTPLVINIERECSTESIRSIEIENKRIQSALEAVYYHPTLIPTNPQGPPVYTFTHSKPKTIEFGPLEVNPNTEPRALPKPVLSQESASSVVSNSSMSEGQSMAPVSTESIASLFSNPEFLRALQQTTANIELPESKSIAPPPIAAGAGDDRMRGYPSQYNVQSMFTPNPSYTGGYGRPESRFNSEPGYPRLAGAPIGQYYPNGPHAVRVPDYYANSRTAPMRSYSAANQVPMGVPNIQSRGENYGMPPPPISQPQAPQLNRYPAAVPPPPPVGLPPHRNPAMGLDHGRRQVPPPPGYGSRPPPPGSLPMQNQAQPNGYLSQFGPEPPRQGAPAAMSGHPAPVRMRNRNAFVN